MGQTGKATLVIASAVPESRRRWSRRLQDTFAVCEVAERRALEQAVANLKPSVVVLDLCLPQLGGVRGLPAIQQLSLSTKTLVLTDAPEREGIAALKAGARGYYSRGIDPGHLKKAVEAVQKGEIWVQRKLISSLVAELLSLTEHRQESSSAKPERRLEGLTAQQRQVADLISRGACNKEVASRLNIAERTVRAHLTEAFRSFGVSDRVQLALLLNGHARPCPLASALDRVSVSRDADTGQTGKATLVIASAVTESRRHWSQTLQETFAVCEVAERRALEQVVANLKPAVVVLDLSLPELGGSRGLPSVQQLSPSTKTLVLTNAPGEGQAIAALKAGARGYYSRAIDPGHLKKAVEAVQKGEIWLQRKLIPTLVAELMSLTERRQKDAGANPDHLFEGLTARQRLVADLISTGACNKEIAAELNISERTVKAHLTETFRSLGVSDRLQLALLLNGDVAAPPHPAAVPA